MRKKYCAYIILRNIDKDYEIKSNSISSNFKNYC